MKLVSAKENLSLRFQRVTFLKLANPKVQTRNMGPDHFTPVAMQIDTYLCSLILTHASHSRCPPDGIPVDAALPK